MNKNKNFVLIALIGIFALFAIASVSAFDWSWLTGKATTASDSNPTYGPYRLYEGKSTTINVGGLDFGLKLLTVADSDTAVISIEGEQKTVTTGYDYLIGGAEITIKSIGYSTKASIFGSKNYITFTIKKIDSTTPPTCTDSDGGINPHDYGYIDIRPGKVTLDACVLVSSYDSDGTPGGWEGVNSCSGKDCYIQEAYCKTDNLGNLIDADATQLIECTDCSKGACTTSITPVTSEVTYMGVLEMLKKCTYNEVELSEYPISCSKKCAIEDKVALSSFVVGQYRTKQNNILAESYSSYFVNVFDTQKEWSGIGSVIQELIEENLKGVANSGDVSLICQCCSAP